jgi:hypothetical protein
VFFVNNLEPVTFRDANAQKLARNESANWYNEPRKLSTGQNINNRRVRPPRTATAAWDGVLTRRRSLHRETRTSRVMAAGRCGPSPGLDIDCHHILRGALARLVLTRPRCRCYPRRNCAISMVVGIAGHLTRRRWRFPSRRIVALKCFIMGDRC